jgi:hypothetical protein
VAFLIAWFSLHCVEHKGIRTVTYPSSFSFLSLFWPCINHMRAGWVLFFSSSPFLFRAKPEPPGGHPSQQFSFVVGPYVPLDTQA